ncbi:hypothetical protein F5Y13DRAFT_204453 [Hypoxylon sp. FL1857]|nr:hypothetical protein F5Y13DRAFT_204453 [Hypoxylon sp. FL1857]
MDNVDSIDAGDLGPAVLGVAWTFASVSILIVSLRFYVRLSIVRKLTLDDYVIIVTLIFSLGNSIILTVSTSWGLGRHIESLASEPLSIMYTVKWVYFCELFAIMSPGFGRISFAILLLNLSPPSKARRRFLWAIIWIQFIVDVGTVIIIYAQCQPIEGYWNKSIEARCLSLNAQVYAGYLQSAVGSLVDLILAIFPSTLFWNLNMQWKQKAFLSGIMGLGIVAMVASIVKTVQLRAITEVSDITYTMATLAIWWTLEANLVLIAVSIPTIRPILKAPKDSTRDRSGPSDNVNTFFSWKRAQANRSGEDRALFGPIQDPASTNEISGDEEQQLSQHNSYCMGAISERGARDSSTGIRKDITVSITFNEGSELSPPNIVHKKAHSKGSATSFTMGM